MPTYDKIMELQQCYYYVIVPSPSRNRPFGDLDHNPKMIVEVLLLPLLASEDPQVIEPFWLRNRSAVSFGLRNRFRIPFL